MLSIFPRIDWPSVCLLWQMFLKLCLFFENSFICSAWVISITLLVHWSILLHHLIYSCFLMFFVCLFVSVIVFFSSVWFFFMLSNPLYYLTFLFWVFWASLWSLPITVYWVSCFSLFFLVLLGFYLAPIRSRSTLFFWSPELHDLRLPPTWSS